MTRKTERKKLRKARSSSEALAQPFFRMSRALTIGEAYRAFLGQEPNIYDHQMAGSAMRFSSAQAEALRTNIADRVEQSGD